LVEVGSDVARFHVAARAESIRRAVEIAQARYPGADARVVHPIDPEPFFVKDLQIPAGLVEIEIPESMAG
jgi:hypothetical protein